MIRKLFSASFACGLLCLNSQFVAAVSKRITADKIADVESLLQEKAVQYGAENILVIWDIDHTLLTPFADLGASYWFKWQVGLLETPERESEQIASNLTELGELTTKVLCAIEFRAVESQTVRIYSDTLRRGFPTLLLTARSPDLRDPTEKELKHNHLTLPSIPVGRDVKEKWLVGKDHDTGDLSAEEIVAAKLEKPRPVSYRHGIMMTNEQDKGAMLRALLHRVGLAEKYKAIVLIDDSRGNCESLERAYGERSPIDLTTFFYTREHPRFEAFKSSDHWGAVAEWERTLRNPAFRKARRNACR